MLIFPAFLCDRCVLGGKRCYYQEQKILCATEFTEDAEKT